MTKLNIVAAAVLTAAGITLGGGEYARWSLTGAGFSGEPCAVLTLTVADGAEVYAENLEIDVSDDSGAPLTALVAPGKTIREDEYAGTEAVYPAGVHRWVFLGAGGDAPGPYRAVVKFQLCVESDGGSRSVCMMPETLEISGDDAVTAAAEETPETTAPETWADLLSPEAHPGT